MMKPIEQNINEQKCGLCAVKWPCPFLLDNELALITGGGSGLCLAMARCGVAAAGGGRVSGIGYRVEVWGNAAI